MPAFPGSIFLGGPRMAPDFAPCAMCAMSGGKSPNGYTERKKCRSLCAMCAVCAMEQKLLLKSNGE